MLFALSRATVQNRGTAQSEKHKPEYLLKPIANLNHLSVYLLYNSIGVYDLLPSSR